MTFRRRLSTALRRRGRASPSLLGLAAAPTSPCGHSCAARSTPSCASATAVQRFPTACRLRAARAGRPRAVAGAPAAARGRVQFVAPSAAEHPVARRRTIRRRATARPEARAERAPFFRTDMSPASPSASYGAAPGRRRGAGRPAADEVDHAAARVCAPARVVRRSAVVSLRRSLGAWSSRASLRPVRRCTRATTERSPAPDLAHGADAGDATTSSAGSLARSTRRSTRSSGRSPRSASSWPTRRTSCGPRSPASGRTSRCCSRSAELHEERRELLDDVVSRLDELTLLVDDSSTSRAGRAGRGLRGSRPCTSWSRRRRRGPGACARRPLRRRARAARRTRRPGRLGRAVSNLLDNAAKWSPPAGRLTCAFTTGAHRSRSWPGFTADDLPFVFDRFYRAPTRATCRAPGSGSRSSGRSPRPTEGRSRPRTRRAAAPCCGSPSTATESRSQKGAQRSGRAG